MAAPAQAESTPKTAPGPAPAGIDPNASADDLTKTMEDLRGDLQRWGAGLGAVATALLTGLGWTQADKLFPLPGPWWIKVLLGASAIGALGGSVYLFSTLYGAQKRLAIGSAHPIPRDQGLDGWERREAEELLDEQARMECAEHICDVDARAQRLDRIATRLELDHDDLAPRARKESDRLNGYVGLALRRVALAIFERRARNAITSWQTATALVLAAAGLAGLFALSNWAKGARDSRKPQTALDCIAKIDRQQLPATLAGKLETACVKLLQP